jgi:hypothetical protein
MVVLNHIFALRRLQNLIHLIEQILFLVDFFVEKVNSSLIFLKFSAFFSEVSPLGVVQNT